MIEVSISPTVPECGCAEYRLVPTCFDSLAFELGLAANAEITGYFMDMWGNVSAILNGIVDPQGRFIYEDDDALEPFLSPYNGTALTFWFTQKSDPIDARIIFPFNGMNRDCAKLIFSTCDQKYDRVNLLANSNA